MSRQTAQNAADNNDLSMSRGPPLRTIDLRSPSGSLSPPSPLPSAPLTPQTTHTGSASQASSPSPYRITHRHPIRSFDSSVPPFVPRSQQGINTNTHGPSNPNRVSGPSGSGTRLHFGDIPPMQPAPPAGPSSQRQRLRQLAETDAGVGLQPLGVRRNGVRPLEPIDLTGDDSEDEPVVTGENIVQRVPTPNVLYGTRPPGQEDNRQQQRTGDVRNGQNEFERAIADIDRTLARRRQQTEAILEADLQDPRRRQVLSPPVPADEHEPNRPRISLGGAVMRRGDRQINFVPTRARQHPRVLPDAGFPPVEERPWPRSMGNAFAQMIARVEEGLDFGLSFLTGRDGGPLNNGAGGVGGAARVDDVSTKAERVALPDYTPPTSGFTVNFEIDGKADPIMVDDNGDIVTSNDTTKPYLQCANCTEPLLVSSAYRSPDDKVWALRCGHVIDQRCLTTISTPSATYPLPVLGEEDGKFGRNPKRRKSNRKTSHPKAEVYEWTCPVAGCGMPHLSEKKGEEWTMKGDEGAFALYI